MMVYISDPKKSMQKLLQLINILSKVDGHKTNSNKLVALLYSKEKWSEKEIKEMTPFTIFTNNMKYFGVMLTKQVKDLYDRNVKYLKKVTE